MSTGLAVSAQAITKTWPDGTRALAGVDCSMRRSEITAVIGANAAGKSTLLRILAGALATDEGDVTLLGEALGSGCFANARLRTRIGYIAQVTELDPEMTGREALELFATLHGVVRDARVSHVDSVAEAFGLRTDLDRLAKRYSGGMRRRLHVSCGLVHDPELLLLDEPMAGLDPGGRAMLWEELRARASRGAAVCLASHDLGDVEEHADTVWVMDGGELIATGSPRELIAEYGQCSITATFAAAVSADAVDQALASTDGVISVVVQRERVIVQLEDVRSYQGHVLAAFAKVTGKLVCVDLQRPSLAGALRAITGVAIDQDEYRDHGQGGGGGRGMGRGLNRRGR